jgi:hypothetical protein
MENKSMAKKCIIHQWNNGCKCLKCGETRDKLHIWNHCVCSICGKKQDAFHVFKPVIGKCVEKCEVCGKEKERNHIGQSCVCERCGKIKQGNHKWGCKTVGDGPDSILKCRLCGESIAWHIFNQRYKTPGNIGGGSSRMMNHLWTRKVQHGDECCFICADCGQKQRNQEAAHEWEHLPDCRKKCNDCGIIYYDHNYIRTGETLSEYFHMDSYETRDVWQYKCTKCGHIGWDSSGWDRERPYYQLGRVEK